MCVKPNQVRKTSELDLGQGGNGKGGGGEEGSNDTSGHVIIMVNASSPRMSPASTPLQELVLV